MTKRLRVVAGLSVGSFGLLPLLLSGCASAAEPEASQEEDVEATQQELFSLQPVRCDKLTFPVALAEGQPASYNVVGWLCGRGSIQNKPIQVLVHGITYSHVYWDFPYKPAQYSYVNALTAAGYATLNLDRIGIGESDHPPALDVTVHSNAHVLHQVVQKLRSRTLQAPTFGRVDGKRVMLVGHSLGSSISMLEAATYHDVDGLIITDFIHNFGPGAIEVGSQFIPAQLEPRFATLPPGYLTTAAGGRGGSWFYYAPTTDPNVVAQDEATKQTGTFGEGGDSNAGNEVSAQIDVPVLSVVGDYDRLACNDPTCTQSGVLANEPQYFSPAARFKAVAIPYAGHNINLHKQAPAWFALAAAWSIANVGIDTRFPAPR